MLADPQESLVPGRQSAQSGGGHCFIQRPDHVLFGAEGCLGTIGRSLERGVPGFAATERSQGAGLLLPASVGRPLRGAVDLGHQKGEGLPGVVDLGQERIQLDQRVLHYVLGKLVADAERPNVGEQGGSKEDGQCSVALGVAGPGRLDERGDGVAVLVVDPHARHQGGDLVA
ncbi:MAG: hypothetical protein JO086_02150 [Acidimicrobiia bacterium]|nr:hypothetical protein [Acidimicrobiia bacterium]